MEITINGNISFVSLEPDSDETRLMYTRSDPEEFMNGSETEEIIESLYRSLLQKYQVNLNEKMRGSDFVFNGINYFYYDFNRVSISKGGSYIDSPKWLKRKKSTVNQKNNDNKCFQYATTLALNFNKINKDPQRISKIIKNTLLRITTGIILIFLQPKKIGIDLKLIIKMLLLIFYIFLLILKKSK